MKEPREDRYSGFHPGFRISAFDTLILLSGALSVLYCQWDSPTISLLIALPIIHFFLFCNVFRIERKEELIWAASYITSSYVALKFNPFPVFLLIGYNLAFAAILIYLETKKPGYHGILWQKLNPNLEAWWRNNAK